MVISFDYTDMKIYLFQSIARPQRATYVIHFNLIRSGALEAKAHEQKVILRASSFSFEVQNPKNHILGLQISYILRIVQRIYNLSHIFIYIYLFSLNS